jgi:hypothetical protein
MITAAALIEEDSMITMCTAAGGRRGPLLTLLTGLTGVLASGALIWGSAVCPDAGILGVPLDGPPGRSAAPASGRTMCATAGVHLHDVLAILREGPRGQPDQPRRVDPPCQCG